MDVDLKYKRHDLKNPNQLVDYLHRFTEIFTQHSTAHPAEREAAIQQFQFPCILQSLQSNDQFAGKLEWPLLCFSPQVKAKAGIGFAYCFDLDKATELTNARLSEQNKVKLKEIVAFWKHENSASKTRAAFDQDLLEAFPSDNWLEDSGVAFPLYRMAGIQLNYKKLLTKGIDGMRIEIQDFSKMHLSELPFYHAMLKALDTFSDCCQFYTEEAKLMAQSAVSDEVFQEKTELSQCLEKISKHPPATLKEAFQLVHLYALISGSLNYGRMDDYLGSFLFNDLTNGKLDSHEALELIKHAWRIIRARDHIHDCRITIGGRGRENENDADHFCLFAMEASKELNDVLPQLSLRIYKGMNSQVWQKAMECIAEGTTFPMLYNDDVNIEGVKNAFKVNYEEAAQYVPYGCGELVINHRSVGSPNGVINLLKVLEVTLKNNRDPLTGQRINPDAPDISINSFTDLWQAYTSNVAYYVKQLAKQQELEYKIAGESAPFLFLSLLFDDCMQKGLGIFAGGAKYLGGTLESYGNINTADSLLVIKKLVFEEKILSVEKLNQILDQNFEGFEKERKWMLRQPKYGNDLEEADAMAQKVHDHLCYFAQQQIDHTKLDSYLVVLINNSANTILGKQTLASADGRKAFSSMANGNNPAPGMDQSGITAFLNSLVKLSPHHNAGMVQNMKFTPEMFIKYEKQTMALLASYFESGGSQAMISVYGKDDLRNALLEPEKYANLMVRVGGFSARFVELEPDVQQEIIDRTHY